MKFRLHSFHYRVILIIVGTALYFMANIQRTAIPGAIFNILQQDLQVSAPYITSLGAAFMYVYAVNQLLSGMLIEKYGGARVIAAGSLFFCAGSLIFPLSESLFWLYFGRALTGLGASSIYLSLVKEIKRTSSDKNFSVALSVMVFAGYTGGIMANAPFVAGVNVIGWRPMMLLIALASIAFFVLFLFSGYLTKLPKIRRERQTINFRPFFELVKIRHNLCIFGFSGLNFGTFYVIQTMIGKKFLEDFCRMPSVNAAWVLSLMATLAAVVGMLFAVCSRLAGNRRRIFIQSATVTVAAVFFLIILALIFNIRTSGIAVLFCILTLANPGALVVPLIHEANPPRLAGSAVSFMNFNCYIVVAILGNAVGLLMDFFRPEVLADGVMLYGRGSYLAVFAVLFLLACFSVRCAWKVRETRGRSIAAEIT